MSVFLVLSFSSRIFISLADAIQCPTYNTLNIYLYKTKLLPASIHNSEDLSSAQQGGQAGNAGKLMPWKQLNQRWEGNWGVNTLDSSCLNQDDAGIPTQSSGISHQDWVPVAGDGNCPENELFLASFLSLTHFPLPCQCFPRTTSPTKHMFSNPCLGNQNWDCSTPKVHRLTSCGLKVECRNTWNLFMGVLT